jgi:hypothetical protein
MHHSFGMKACVVYWHQRRGTGELRRLREMRRLTVTSLIGFFTLSIILWNGARPVLASTCVACHTNRAALKNNLSPVKEKKSAMTSGAG